MLTNSERFRVPKPSGAQLLRLVGSSATFVIVALIVVFAQTYAVHRGAAVFLGALVLLAALAFFGVLAIRVRSIGQLKRVAPTELVFTIASGGGTGPALESAFPETELGLRAAGFSVSLGVSVGDDGVSFWDNNPPQLAGRIGWSQIRSVSFGSIGRRGKTGARLRTDGYRDVPSPLISVDSPAGESVRIPLDGANPSRLPALGTTLYASWVADQLSALLVESRSGS